MRFASMSRGHYIAIVSPRCYYIGPTGLPEVIDRADILSRPRQAKAERHGVRSLDAVPKTSRASAREAVVAVNWLDASKVKLRKGGRLEPMPLPHPLAVTCHIHHQPRSRCPSCLTTSQIS